MNKNNVLVFEDDGSALSFIEMLEEFYGFDVYRTPRDWSYVTSWLTDDTPGADSFAALIFDLKVPAYNLEVYGGKPYNEGKHYSPALYFIDYFLRVKFPNMLDRVILFSAYFGQMEDMGIKLNEFIMFDKHKDDVIDGLITKLLQLRG